MIERQFRTAYRDLDAVVVALLWDVYRHSKWDQRANIETALDRLRAAHEVEAYASDPRRSMAP